jgi:transposase
MLEIVTKKDTEVIARPKRRGFTAEYKRRIVAEADRCTTTGEIGALLRREGLYSSHLANWRAAGKAVGTKRRGPTTQAKNPLEAELRATLRENAVLKARLAKAELLVDIQKKVASLLGLTVPSPDEHDSSCT